MSTFTSVAVLCTHYRTLIVLDKYTVVRIIFEGISELCYIRVNTECVLRNAY